MVLAFINPPTIQLLVLPICNNMGGLFLNFGLFLRTVHFLNKLELSYQTISTLWKSPTVLNLYLRNFE